MGLNIQIDKFEGPLALLLHLIRKEEMDIFDINIQHITAQYLEYIKVMKQLDLELAGEFVAMEATLIHLKSRMLLPQYDDQGDEVEAEDPRKELVQKLIEYQMYKDASEKLYARTIIGRDVWPRGARVDLSAYKPEDEIVIEDNPLFSLIAAYRLSMRNMKKTVHRVMRELQSISDRVNEIKNRLMVGKTIKFYQLIDTTGTYKSNQVLITFLSMLELAKIGLVSLFQTEGFSEIHVTTLKKIDTNVLERIEDYENPNAEATSQALFGDPQAASESTKKGLASIEPAEEKAPEQLQLSIEDTEVDSPNIVRNFLDKHPSSFEPPRFTGEVSEEGIEAATDEEILQEEERLSLGEDDASSSEGVLEGDDTSEDVISETALALTSDDHAHAVSGLHVTEDFPVESFASGTTEFEFKDPEEVLIESFVSEKGPGSSEEELTTASLDQDKSQGDVTSLSEPNAVTEEALHLPEDFGLNQEFQTHSFNFEESHTGIEGPTVSEEESSEETRDEGDSKDFV